MELLNLTSLSPSRREDRGRVGYGSEQLHYISPAVSVALSKREKHKLHWQAVSDGAEEGGLASPCGSSGH